AEEGGTSAVLGIDERTGQVVSRYPAQYANRLVLAAGDVWLGSEGDGIHCEVQRLDPADLHVKAKIPVPCDAGGPTFAALDGDIWLLDRTPADINARNGLLRRIDPATNTISGNTVNVPFVNGSIAASEPALFWQGFPNDPQSPDAQVWRLTPGAKQLESLGRLGTDPIFPQGTGVWVATER